MLRIILFSGFLFLSSCSPFGGASLIEEIGGAIARLFGGESSNTIVSGATQVVETNPSLPAQNYKVTTSVGEVFNQQTVQTGDGYTVQTAIQ